MPFLNPIAHKASRVWSPSLPVAVEERPPADDVWQKLRTKTKDKFKREWKEVSPADIKAQTAKCVPLVVKISQTMKRVRP
jgi:hypothetical protein